MIDTLYAWIIIIFHNILLMILSNIKLYYDADYSIICSNKARNLFKQASNEVLLSFRLYNFMPVFES